MAAIHTLATASNVFLATKTTSNTPPNSRPAPNARTRQPPPASPAAATQPEITLIDRLVNNIVPR